MKTIILLLLTTFTAFSQKDTISPYRVTTIFDSLTSTRKYYALSVEKFKELKENALFAKRNDYSLIENSIVKISDKCYGHIQNGVVVKKDCYENPQDKLCIFDIPYYDPKGNLTKTVSCNYGKLVKVERINDQERIVCSYTFGHLSRVEKYLNNKDGYVYEVNNNGNILTYQVYLKPDTKEIIRRELISTQIFSNVDAKDSVFRDYEWSSFYDEDPSQCQCKKN